MKDILLKSTSVIAIMMATSFNAIAQEKGEAALEKAEKPPARQEQANDEPIEEVVVTGIRASLRNSQGLKRDADNFMDAITADDIGALPDRSVLEALQRVPGVSMTRFNGPNDPDHFSVEGSGVVIRGLNMVRSEINGRDTFSANNGRSLSFADVPSELIQSVQVSKNQSSDMIEGGIAGTVNLVTRKPFDQKGMLIAGSAEASYGDFSKKWSPTYSGLFSNRWDTNIGEMGFLVNGVYSRLKTRTDGVQVSSFVPNTDGYLPGKTAYIPEGAAIRTQNIDRIRKGIGAAAQWESPDRTAKATFQFLRSEATQAWTEFAVEVATDAIVDSSVTLVPGTEYGFDNQNMFTHGVVTAPTGWRSGQCPGWRGCSQYALDHEGPADGYGLQTNNIRRDNSVKNITSDYGFNLSWVPTDRLAVNLDYQYVKSSSSRMDVQNMGSTLVNMNLDLRGKIPQIQFLAPSRDGSRDAESAAYFADPKNSFWRSVMDHTEQNEGTENAFRADLEYSVDSGWIQFVRAGVRYNKRDQKSRVSAYNWGVISELWAAEGPVWLDEKIDGVPQDFMVAPTNGQSAADRGWFVREPFNGFFRGQSNTPIVPFVPALDFINNSQEAIAAAKLTNQEWRNNATDWRPLNERDGVIAGTPFLPNEINTTSENTKAVYLMTKFSNPEPLQNGITVSGNIGVRYVNTKNIAYGSFAFPRSVDLTSETSCNAVVNPNANNASLPAFCKLTPERRGAARQYSTGEIIPNTAGSRNTFWLPSFNLKIGFDDDKIIRFGYSHTIRRPDLGLTRNFFTIVQRVENLNFLGFKSDTGNAYLKPMLSKQMDLAFEWYFTDTGSLTVAGFTKAIHGVITNGISNQAITNNGETFNVQVVRPVNSDSVGRVKGFEIAYQQFYNMLPAPFDGLGLQANYTYVKSKGVKQNSFSVDATNPAGNVPIIDTSLLPLQGLSKHTFNVAGMYEKGPLAIRVAFNWRSEYLLTVRDVITPFVPILLEGTGQLDASIFYNITGNIKLGIQGVNILDDTTVTRQIINKDLLIAPRSYFKNDRRFTLILRFKY